jgi:hypothetical protein
MDAELFKTLGQIAGIGGLALGVFLILFRELIRKSIFPTLKKDQAYKLFRLIAFLVCSVTLAGIAAWIYVENHPQVKVTSGVGAGRDVNVNGNIIIDREKKKLDK